MSSARIEPDWTLNRLKREFPGVELALFAHFGVGSRERSGFHGEESLEELLRRHLVFDAPRACARLNSLAMEDQEYSLDCRQLEAELRASSVVVVDARADGEFERCRLPGSLWLSHDTVNHLKSQSEKRLVVLCRDGSQAPAASRILRAQGLSARHLLGGLERWSEEIDPDFPLLFPLEERPGRWHLLADGETLRFRRNTALAGRKGRILDRKSLNSFALGQTLLAEFPVLEFLALSAETFALRGLSGDLQRAISFLNSELRDSEQWEAYGEEPPEQEERLLLERVLQEEAPKILASHKGTVELCDYRNRVLTLALGGGCAGCASAQITTQRELAAALYRAVPLLDSIKS